jgi:uncharacterized protein YaiI (UPF0178 family)
LRGSEVEISGPENFNQGGRQAFAAQLEKFFTRK